MGTHSIPGLMGEGGRGWERMPIRMFIDQSDRHSRSGSKGTKFRSDRLGLFKADKRVEED
jgi:hypothetical protein